MSNEINLLKKESPGTTHQISESKFLLVRIFSVTLPFAVVVSLGIIFFLKSQSPVSRLESEQKSLSTQLSLLHTKTAKYMLINERLNFISAILDKRVDLEKLVSFILQDIPSDVSISTLTVSKDEASISLTSPSLLSINKVVEHFLSLAKEKKVLSSVVMNSLNFDTASNIYSISLKARIQSI